ncbi:MAG: glycerophosphodiester phosphodiesterase family protein [Bacilli bacterium]|nr:glycerophosphodiester phosphodiesterase family protein [Bacilli bacterium]
MINLIAHRGNNNHEYKENTVNAILASLKEDYISGVELDVRLTKDNKLVVIHDYTINRTSNGSGIVKNMTIKELRKYNFGSKNKPDRIPLLDEVLKKIRSNKIIILELKTEFDDITEISNRVIKIVKKYPKLNIYLTGFSHKLTSYLKQKGPNLKIGFANIIVTKKTVFDDSYDGYFINYKFFDNYETKKPLFFWTINRLDFFDDKDIINDNMYFITDKAYLLKDIKKSLS